ncbi:MAG TPA: hypothetical protein VEK09_00180 [Jatrophihabitantaceae bacterium]|nr:hypothetical protein [Jatrophihabitantaceae bacterium]
MSLTAITADLEAQWRRTVRRNQPTIRWATVDPHIPADADELRRQLVDCFSPNGRDLLRRVVTLAAAGDHDAALAATLTVLARLVRWEAPQHRRRNSTVEVEHDALAASVWEAIVTERRPERPFLRERIEQVAWGAVKKPVIRSRREPASARVAEEEPAAHIAHAAGSRRDPAHRDGRLRRVEGEALSAVTIETLLDRLAAAGRLSANARTILENVAAGGDGLRHDPSRGPRAAATERLRLITRLRHDPRVRAALAG